MDFYFLSESFYNDYANCPEIEQKANRPHAQALVRLNGVVFAVPLRSHIKHKYVYWTDKESCCGLDFSKTVVLTKRSYINRENKPYIRPNEFDALRGKEYIIQQKLLQYIKTYNKARARQDIPRNKTMCQYSTLQYFEKYL